MKRFFSNVGSPWREIKEPFYDENGSLSLRVVGKENTDDYIQSFRQSCDINSILARFQNGDTSALSAHEVFNGDFVNMPHSIIEFMNLQSKVESSFYSLPLEVREKFDNDSKKFFASFGTNDFFEAFKKDDFPIESEDVKE